MFWQGLLIGFSIAAPVGPIGVLCIRRTLVGGRAAGLLTGLGAASADAVFSSIAAFGLTLVSGFLISQQWWVRLIGGLFLCYLSARTLRSRPAEHAAQTGGVGLLGAYVSTFFLTLTNPASIVLFAAIFASLGMVNTSDGYATALALVGGVFLGSALWWLLLSSGVSMLRSHFDARALMWVNRVSGVIIGGFGLAALVSIADCRL